MKTLPAGRGARTAAAAVVLLLVVLVAVLAGLLGSPGSDGSGASPAGSTRASASRSSVATAPTTRRPSGGATATTGSRDPQSGLRVVALARLPREAQQAVALIDAGGPFPYAKDGVTFGNNERVLPAHPRGWYREYTVRTPGENDRGPRRIVTGDDDREIFYTGDHYVTFVRVTR